MSRRKLLLFFCRIMVQEVFCGMNISKNIEENKKHFKALFHDSADIKIRDIELGIHNPRRCLLAYIEVSLGDLLTKRYALDQAVDGNLLDLSDAEAFMSIEEAGQAMLTGDVILFVDGYDYAVKIPDKGYPGMDVKESDSEKVVRGSNEAFSDSIKQNTAIIRRRVRSTRVTVKEVTIGVRSHTNIDLVYMEDLASKSLIHRLEEKIQAYIVDGVFDSGMLQHLMKDKWYSPFPQLQTTTRPDRAGMAILEGRVVILVDNSPVALIAPTDVNSFLKTVDDYYNNFETATFARIIRYLATFFSMALPGLYLAAINFHTQGFPTPLILAFWESRIGMPFPSTLEVLLMEISFELLREAGVRLPGAMGNTIGIVGGLIIGQAAVEASLVSPIVVIVVAFTALCSFSIPNEEFAFSFRLLKFFVIAMAAWLGYFGFLISIFMVLIHLAGLESYGIPYLTPFVTKRKMKEEKEQTNDAIWRYPLRFLRKRPVYANEKEKIKLRKREDK